MIGNHWLSQLHQVYLTVEGVHEDYWKLIGTSDCSRNCVIIPAPQQLRAQEYMGEMETTTCVGCMSDMSLSTRKRESRGSDETSNRNYAPPTTPVYLPDFGRRVSTSVGLRTTVKRATSTCAWYGGF